MERGAGRPGQRRRLAGMSSRRAGTDAGTDADADADAGTGTAASDEKRPTRLPALLCDMGQSTAGNKPNKSMVGRRPPPSVTTHSVNKHYRNKLHGKRNDTGPVLDGLADAKFHAGDGLVAPKGHFVALRCRENRVGRHDPGMRLERAPCEGLKHRTDAIRHGNSSAARLRSARRRVVVPPQRPSCVAFLTSVPIV